MINARERASQAGERLTAVQESEAARRRALEATNHDRGELLRALHEIDAALDATRVQRVREFVQTDSPPFYLLEALGEVPLSRGGQQAWCGLATEIERHRDRHAITNEFMALELDPHSEVGRLSDAARSRVHDLISNAAAIIGTAHELEPAERGSVDTHDSEAWAPRIDQARRFLEAMQVAVPEVSFEAEPDIGLGW